MAITRRDIIPVAGAVGTEILSAVPSVIAAGAPFRKTEKERLADLERRAALGTLGFTGDEERALQEQLLSPAQALARQQNLEAAGLFAASGTASGGQAFAQLQQAQEAEQRRIADAQAKIALENVRLQQAQRDEILALQRAEDKAQADRRAAVFQGIADVAGGLFGVGLERRRQAEATGRTGARDRYQTDYLGD